MTQTFADCVRLVVARIPKGETMTYKEVAERAGVRARFARSGIFSTKITIRISRATASSEVTERRAATIAARRENESCFERR
jgi:hypothetical protein